MNDDASGYFTVGEMARYSGIPAKTLRYYDEIGLLRPARRGDGTDYRYYGRWQLEQAVLLQSLKALGMSLGEIRGEFDRMSSRRYSELLRIRAETLEQEIRELNQKKRNLDDWLMEVNEAIAAEPGRCYLRHYPARRGYYYRAAVRSRAELELTMRRVEQSFGGGLHVGRVNRVVALEDLLAGNYLTYSGLFIPETSVVAGSDHALTELPESDCAVVFACALHEDSGQYWERLLRFAADSGYVPCGDACRAIPVEMGISHMKNDYIAKMYVPVRRR